MPISARKVRRVKQLFLSLSMIEPTCFSPYRHKLIMVHKHVDQVLTGAQMRVGHRRHGGRSAARESRQTLAVLEQLHLISNEFLAQSLFLAGRRSAQDLLEPRADERGGVGGPRGLAGVLCQASR